MTRQRERKRCCSPSQDPGGVCVPVVECPAVWPACFPFGQHMKFWDGSVRLSLMPAQVAVSAHTGQLSAVWSGKKAASMKNLGVQEDRLARTGFGPRHLHSTLLGWSSELGTPLPVPEGSSQRPDWLSKTSPTQREPPALLSHSGQGWLAPCAGCWPRQTAGMCVPVRVSSRLLPSDAVWAGVTLSAAVALAKHHGQLHKRRWEG